MTDSTLPLARIEIERSAAVERGYWRSVLGRLRHDPTTLVCLGLLALIVLAVVFAPLLAPHDPYATGISRRLKPIGTAGYPLGTDELGRCILSRILYGGRISLFMGTFPVAVAFVIGGALGIVAGFYGGRVNMAIMRVMDVFYAFPSVLLAVGVSGALGGGMVNGVVSLILIFIPPICRIAESSTTQVRNLDFVEAARASGAGAWPILRTHVLGNVLAPIMIYASGLVSVSIVIASGLSFLGLGVRPPEPDWGLMLSTLRPAIYVQPWVAAMPGVAIFIVSMCFNLVSDGLRSAMDVKM
ncbi:ABC transporter permease [Microvirga pudoricolor]|uniref:ABC transporter permease n=1 Tax=Microvirga pudoricolor TaxID=2778729 RepID=UPI0019505CA2|nr:ABC transporter permease [Microvirga pudoricolor]MBM6595224.1 ABC transporter permease [Microvirga pudoricolor]